MKDSKTHAEPLHIFAPKYSMAWPHNSFQGMNFFMMPLTPPKIKMYPKKGSYQREVSSSNQHFPEDMLVFPGCISF